MPRFNFVAEKITKVERLTKLGFIKFISSFQSEDGVPNIGVSTAIDLIRYAEGASEEEAWVIWNELVGEGLGLDEIMQELMEATQSASFLKNQTGGGLKAVAIQAQS